MSSLSLPKYLADQRLKGQLDLDATAEMVLAAVLAEIRPITGLDEPPVRDDNPAYRRERSPLHAYQLLQERLGIFLKCDENYGGEYESNSFESNFSCFTDNADDAASYLYRAARNEVSYPGQPYWALGNIDLETVRIGDGGVTFSDNIKRCQSSSRQQAIFAALANLITRAVLGGEPDFAHAIIDAYRAVAAEQNWDPNLAGLAADYGFVQIGYWYLQDALDKSVKNNTNLGDEVLAQEPLKLLVQFMA